LRQFLSGLDALSVNLPLTPQTERLFGAAEFAALPLGAFVVNTSRGKVLDQAALVEALQSGHLGGAALDVFVEEPLPAESPLWTMPNVTVTAHLSGPSTPEEVVPQFVANYRRYLAGEAMTGLVDRLKGF
jgi:glyoxylate/hydroxypyruvate reductase A